MSDQTIYRALQQRLSSLSFSPAPQFVWDVSWTDTDGTDYETAHKPAASKAWVRGTYLSEGDIPITTGPIQTRAQRLFVVDCYVPEKKGLDEAFRLADAVSAHFFPATGEPYSIISGSINIQINRRPEKQPLDARSGFVGVAVLVHCVALIN